MVFNPTPRPRTGLVRLDVALPAAGAPVALHTGAGQVVPTQRLAAAPTLLADDWYDETDLPVVLARLHGVELYGQEVTRWSVSPPRPAGPDGRPGRPGALTFQVARHGDQTFDVAEVRAALAEATARPDGADTADPRPAVGAEPHQPAADGDPGRGWSGRPGGTGRRWRVRILAEPRATVAALVEVPALGWTSVRPVPADGATRDDPENAGRLAEPEDGGRLAVPAGGATRSGPTGGPARPPEARARGRTLDNGLLRVEVADDGTLGLYTPDGLRVEGLGRIVDGGDVGDSYNYAPPATDSLVDKAQSVRTAILHEGPVTAVLDVLRTYRWPVAAEVVAGTRSVRTESVTVTTRLELRAAEPFVRVTVSFDNRSADHRVRAHLPLPSRADVSYAQGQFAVVARGLTSEGGSGEVPLPTYPAAGFVAAGGAGGSLAVLLTQPSEYELVDGGRELALTLLRSVGMLSRNRNPMRDEPAGPQVPTPSAQCRGSGRPSSRCCRSGAGGMPPGFRRRRRRTGTGS
ncbi:hypothetical protein GCM10027615_56310 [Plantactinospora veratri]